MDRKLALLAGNRWQGSLSFFVSECINGKVKGNQPKDPFIKDQFFPSRNILQYIAVQQFFLDLRPIPEMDIMHVIEDQSAFWHVLAI